MTFEHAGDTKLSKQGQAVIPKAAREGANLDTDQRLFVFVDSDAGHVLLTHLPLADDLIELAAKAARRKRASL